MMNRLFIFSFGLGGLIILVLGVCLRAEAHERDTTAVTWTLTISRIVFERCGSCHHDGGTAFSLMTYDDARPWAVAIKEEIFSRSMPPWGAVKGFGTFRNDEALSPAQTNLIVSWIEGGVPEGDEADLPGLPELSGPAPVEHSPGEIIVRGDFILESALVLDGLWPHEVPEEDSVQITAQLPDGRVETLLWLYNYRPEYSHPFLFETPLDLPAGTVIRGVPAGSSVALLPLVSTPASED